jgi:hypothetical protein
MVTMKCLEDPSWSAYSTRGRGHFIRQGGSGVRYPNYLDIKGSPEQKVNCINILGGQVTVSLGNRLERKTFSTCF